MIFTRIRSIFMVVCRSDRWLIFVSLMPCQGGFVEGYASAYNGTGIVGRSVGLNAPIIYVSFNYRLNGTLFFW